MQAPSPFINVLEKMGQGENKVIALNAPNDILYAQYLKGSYTSVHAANGHTYYTTTSLFELELILEHFDFLSLNRDAIVNMKKIKAFDENYGKVFFTESPVKDSPHILATRVAYKRIEKYYDYKSLNKTKTSKNFIWSYLSNQ